MANQPLFFALSLCLITACGSSPNPTSTAALDYVELRGDDGWYLRVHGDGSGSLTHRQHPTHHLDYPAHTFDPLPLLRLGGHCIGQRLTSSGCYTLTRYRAARDQLLHCSCTKERAATAAFTTAVARMQWAVDDESSERACRMLRRAWLVAR